METVYLHDSTFEGQLTAVAKAVKSTHLVKSICFEEGYTPGLFETVVLVETENAQALRLFEYLQNLKSGAAQLAMSGFLSEEPDVGMHLYQLVLECLDKGAVATRFYANDSIRHLQQLSQKVKYEAHRYNGLIRFRILDDGLLYAPFEPDCNVIGYCADHFVKRLRNLKWILHDVQRDIALYWDGEKLQDADINKDFTQEVRLYGEIPENRRNADELYYQNLWKSFHTVIANPARRNPGLQRQYMPARYWKYLVEMS